MSVDDQASAILRRAASIVRQGWSQGAPARNVLGNPVTSDAHTPPNIQEHEKPYAPVAFDVNAAIWRAAASPAKGGKGHEGKLGYWAIRPRSMVAHWLARERFCRTASTMHPSDWNDRVCKSAEEAAQMLERAADSVAPRKSGA